MRYDDVYLLICFDELMMMIQIICLRLSRDDIIIITKDTLRQSDIDFMK